MGWGCDRTPENFAEFPSCGRVWSVRFEQFQAGLTDLRLKTLLFQLLHCTTIHCRGRLRANLRWFSQPLHWGLPEMASSLVFFAKFSPVLGRKYMAIITSNYFRASEYVPGRCTANALCVNDMQPRSRSAERRWRLESWNGKWSWTLSRHGYTRSCPSGVSGSLDAVRP